MWHAQKLPSTLSKDLFHRDGFMPELSPGQRFRDSLLAEKPLQIAGTINALCLDSLPDLLNQLIDLKQLYGLGKHPCIRIKEET